MKGIERAGLTMLPPLEGCIVLKLFSAVTEYCGGRRKGKPLGHLAAFVGVLCSACSCL